jgi:hypothetical protein
MRTLAPHAACPAARSALLGAEELFQLDSINRQRTVACGAINAFRSKICFLALLTRS